MKIEGEDWAPFLSVLFVLATGVWLLGSYAGSYATRQQAVKVGAGEWVAGGEGNVVFQWKAD